MSMAELMGEMRIPGVVSKHSVYTPDGKTETYYSLKIRTLGGEVSIPFESEAELRQQPAVGTEGMVVGPPTYNRGAISGFLRDMTKFVPHAAKKPG